MSRRPRIGLNMAVERSDQPLAAAASCHLRYIDALVAAGGLPVLVPPVPDEGVLAEAVEGLDGFCLIGGADYHPEAYGGAPQPAGELMAARRHAFDLALARRLLAGRQPLLGVCAGHQLLNIVLGGGLIQDLASGPRAAGLSADGGLSAESPALPHALAERGSTLAEDAFVHELRLAPDSRLAAIVGATRLPVNSFHHQAIDPRRLGSGLRAVAWSADGVIEAVELTGARFVLGVQWHPERHDGGGHGALFAALVAAASQAG